MMRLTQKDIALGKRIRRLRKKIGMTQEELAERANLSVTHIGLVETGKRRISLQSLQKVASSLRVKTKDLIPY